MNRSSSGIEHLLCRFFASINLGVIQLFLFLCLRFCVDRCFQVRLELLAVSLTELHHLSNQRIDLFLCALIVNVIADLCLIDQSFGFEQLLDSLDFRFW